MLILLKSFFPNILFAGERRKPEISDAASDHSYDLVDSELESAGVDEKEEASAAVDACESERVEESAVCERVEESAVSERVEESAVSERVEESALCEGVEKSAVCKGAAESAVCERVEESVACEGEIPEKSECEVDIPVESAVCERVKESAVGERVEESAACENKCEEAEESAEDILKKKNNMVDAQREDHDRALLMVKTLSRLQLVEMCKKHNLMRTGGKFQLAHRIVLFNKNV